MSHFLISPGALGFLPVLLLHGIALSYLLLRPGKTRSTWYFAGWIASLMLLMGTQGMARLIYAPIGGYIDLIGGTASGWLGLIFALQFAYSFPRSATPREARLVLAVTVGIGLGLLLLSAFDAAAVYTRPCYQFEQDRFSLGPEEAPTGMTAAGLVDILLPPGYLWLAVVWIRKTLHLSGFPSASGLKTGAALPERSVLVGDMTATEGDRSGELPGADSGLPSREGEGRIASPGGRWATFWRQGNPEVQSTRTFALISLAVPLVIPILLLEQIGSVPAGTFSLVYMLGFLALVITYLSHSAEPAALMVKLVGITQVALLAMLQWVSSMALDLQSRADEQLRQRDVTTLAARLRERSSAAALTPDLIPAGVRYVASRPAAGGLFSGAYQVLFPSAQEGQHLALGTQSLEAEDTHLLGRLRLGTYEVWLENPWLGSIDGAARRLAGAGWTRTNIPERTPSYRGVSSTAPENHRIRYAFLSTDATTLYEVGFSNLEARERMHVRALPFVWVTFATCGLILFVYPLFFRTNLAQPLAHLLTGVQRVNAGDLTVRVPVSTSDEVGSLTEAFNRMVHSLLRLHTGLHQEISERTRAENALRESEARYRSLFESSPLSIFEMDIGHSPVLVTRANRMAAKVYGLSPTEWQAAPVDRIFSPESLEDLSEIIKALRDAKSVSIESFGQRHNGTFFPIRVSAAVDASPEARLAILAVEDISIDKARQIEEEAIAQERLRIAHEIHDGLAQDLAGLRLRVDVWHRLLERDPARLHEELDRVKVLLGDNIRDVRRSIYALRPLALDELGFLEALQQLATDFGIQHQLNITLQTSGEWLQVPGHLEPLLYRIIQEALNNVSKHARADAVTISIDAQAGGPVSLQVRDNGDGFEPTLPANPLSSHGLGLVHMRERVARMGGILSVISRRGEGTSIAVELPTERRGGGAGS